MTKTFQPGRLDVAAFAQGQAAVEGCDSLQKYERLALDLRALEPDSMVKWQARGEHRTAADGSVRPALHLRAEADLPLTCQRCMGPMTAPVRIDRHFVFVPDEAAAAALDDESEDDVLELTPALDLHALIEDELLMALPLVPRHETCPGEVRLSARDEGFGADKPNPFAALAALKERKPD
ncbi:YceD family protein [Ottowia sp.]|uniref:YceD family protein n=1 Tax=Ottowia sp. TaxID=1898956 RepID=UPI0039E55E4D